MQGGRNAKWPRWRRAKTHHSLQSLLSLDFLLPPLGYTHYTACGNRYATSIYDYDRECTPCPRLHLTSPYPRLLCVPNLAAAAAAATAIFAPLDLLHNARHTQNCSCTLP